MQALGARFGGISYEDPISDLKNLHQEGTLADYIDSFEQGLNKVNLTSDYAISCFLDGLKDEISFACENVLPQNLV